MGRVRGKGKKLSGNSSRDDTVSGEDFKLPLRRRGRPLKIVVKDEFNNIEEGTSETNEAATGNVNKRKNSPSLVNENEDSTKEENGEGTENNATDLIKSIGYRQIGSRRKNKPRRAAEVGVECK